MTDGINKRYGIIALLAAATIATLGINLVERNTRAQIEANQVAYELAVITEVLPEGSYDNEPHTDVIWLSDEELPGSTPALPAYRARQADRQVATALTTIAEDGYVGPIRLLIGIDADGNIIRVRPTEHRETPGLGDKLEPGKSDWITQFDGAQPATEDTMANWKLRRDGGELDQISGATVTSRAIIRAVRQAQVYYLENSERINAPLSTEPLSTEPLATEE
jgi:electron transport complex protein RnfG